jgi:dihydroorotase
MVASDLVEGDLLIDAGKVVGLVNSASQIEALETIDASGRLVLPGIVDTHAHTREPGYEHKEDFLTASQAAAVGGVTTMVDMPNVDPPTDTIQALEQKKELAKKSVIDVGHWAAGTQSDQILKLAEGGALGYKIFQVSGAYPHDPRLALNDDGALLRNFRLIAETGLPCLVHPFNQSLFEYLTSEALEAGKPADYETFGEVYTTEQIWATAVNTLINLQELSGVRLHLLHTHAATSLALIRAAKGKGQAVTAAVDPKYYHLTLDDLRRQKGRACPGGFITQDASRMEAIWCALRDGTIDLIDADHAPHTLDEIAVLETDAFNAAMGSPQYDWHYSITLTDVSRGRLSLHRAVQLLSEMPARFIGLYPKKGVLLPGSDADLVIVDPDEERVLTDDGLYTQVGWTPYRDWTVKGVVHLTMLRGMVIARDREVVAAAGSGQPLT